MKLLKENIWLIVLFGVSFLAVIPFFHSGFFNIHDDAQIQRVFEMKVALLDGSFPVRWVGDLGYGLGYPIFNFYGPLPYYLGAIFSIFTTPLMATKIMILIGVIGSSFSMYFLAKEFWGKIGGFFSALLYLFAPYHALNVYVRGDIGEVYAYLFAPIIFYAIWKFYKTSKYSFIVIGALAYCGLIISHNLSAMMLSPFILFVVIILAILKRKYSIFLIPLLGIMISSFYFIPALSEIKYTNLMSAIGGTADFHDHFVCPIQLWSSPWMFGGSSKGCIDGLSFRLGKLHFIFVVTAILFALWYFKKEKEKSIAVLLTSLFLLLSIFLMLDQSRFIWEIIPQMKFFQYPWRFLLAASLFSSFLSGSIIYFLSKNQTQKNKVILYGIYLILLISPVILYSKIFAPQTFLAKKSEDYTNQYSLSWTTSKISDEYMPPNFSKPKSPNDIIKNKISANNVLIEKLSQKSNKLYVEIFAPESSDITIHIPFFPAWKFYLNGQIANYKVTNTGVLITIPKGRNIVEARFKQTNIELLANLITISGILILFVGIIYNKRKK
jgi:hypothetical protein